MKKMRDDAWTEFHARYFPRLYRYALTLHRGDHASAEDAVQAGFLRAVRHIRRFEDEEAFWCWLTLLLRCAAADQGRRNAARSRLHQSLLAEEATSSRANFAGSETRLVLLEEALDRLDVADRDLLEAKYLHGESSADLARRHNLTEKAVECRLRRLRRKLKSRIHALAKQTVR